MAMNYITSRNIFYLGCEILKFIDSELAHKGLRLAYMTYRMLFNKGGYDEYEIAEFAHIAFLSVIGELALKKNKILFTPTDPRIGVMASLYIKAGTCYGDRADILTYSDLTVQEVDKLDYPYKDVVGVLSIIKKAEELYEQSGKNVTMKEFEPFAGKKYSTNNMMLMLRCIRKDDILSKMELGIYEKELWEFLDYMLFTNEEKDNLIDFDFSLLSFKGTYRYLEPLISDSIADVIAKEILSDKKERERLHIAAMYCDIGELEYSDEELYQTGKLSHDQVAHLREHVEKGERILRKYFCDEQTIDIALYHHERINGMGYPKGRKNEAISRAMRILQVSTELAKYFNPKLYPERKSSDELKKMLEYEADHDRLDDICVRKTVANFDRIEESVKNAVKQYAIEQKEILVRYKTIADRIVKE